MLSPDVIDRIENWKFRSAHILYENGMAGEIPDDSDLANELLIEALARVFGNSGVFPGALGIIVAAAISTLFPPLEGQP